MLPDTRKQAVLYLPVQFLLVVLALFQRIVERMNLLRSVVYDVVRNAVLPHKLFDRHTVPR